MDAVEVKSLYGKKLELKWRPRSAQPISMLSERWIPAMPLAESVLVARTKGQRKTWVFGLAHLQEMVNAGQITIRVLEPEECPACGGKGIGQPIDPFDVGPGRPTTRCPICRGTGEVST